MGPVNGGRGEHLEEQAPHRVEITARVDLAFGGPLLGAHACRCADRDAGAGEPVAQCLPFHERHHIEELTVGIARVEQWDDVRMVELRGQCDLAQEALGPEGARGGSAR